MAPDSFFKIIPKPKPKAPGWISVLFYLSILLIVILVAGFFFLKKEVSSSQHQKQLIDEEIIALTGETQREIEKEIFGAEERIKTFLSIFKNRNIVSNFFSLFESITHPKVQFSNLELNITNYGIGLTGQTDSFQSLGEQVLILEKHEDIKDISLSNISFNREGNIGFSISFSFSSEIFSVQQQYGEQTGETATTTSATTTTVATTTATTTGEE